MSDGAFLFVACIGIVAGMTCGMWALTDLTSALLLLPVFAVIAGAAAVLTAITMRMGGK